MYTVGPPGGGASWTYVGGEQGIGLNLKHFDNFIFKLASNICLIFTDMLFYNIFIQYYSLDVLTAWGIIVLLYLYNPLKARQNANQESHTSFLSYFNAMYVFT